MKWYFPVLAVLVSCSQSKVNDIEEFPAHRPSVIANPSPAYLSPEESIKAMHLPKGYRIELVAAEPMVQEPVAIVWDANGHLYVAEMNTYMQDIDGTGEQNRTCRIVRLTDTDGDGKMDNRTVFIDSLLLPRIILPINDELLIQETYKGTLYAYKDTNNDGVADEHRIVFEDEKPDVRNLEHQKSGLVWNIDNWMYTSQQVRFKWNSGKLVADKMKNAPFGQWGLANDDDGRIFISSAGGEVAALGFQQMPQYGAMEYRDIQYEGDFHQPWPIIATPDVEGGVMRLRDDSTLNHFTGACGQIIYRGDRLPHGLYGDLLICEPVGRLIRRAKVQNKDGIRVLKNAYEQAEFIASSDMNFRPVNMATGPDGALYIVDMYRGIIQEGEWTGPHSYLRKQILRFGLEKNIGRGRIYRVVHDEIAVDNNRPTLLNDNAATLVSYLHHPNAWWRENAQRLLIVKNMQEAIPDLVKIATWKPSFLNFFSKEVSTSARVHALWTLEGLNAFTPQMAIELLKDKDATVRKMAVWASEPWIKEGNAAIIDAVSSMVNDTDVDVKAQIAQSFRYTSLPVATSVFEKLVVDQPDKNGVVHRAANISLGYLTEGESVDVALSKIPAEEHAKVIEGASHYKSLCASCHGSDGKGILLSGSSMAAPALSGSQRVNGNPETLIKLIFNGLEGPVDGNSYPGIMPGMRNNTDDWFAEVISYIRTHLGNNAAVISAEEVKRVREKVKDRWKPWTLNELAEQDAKQH